MTFRKGRLRLPFLLDARGVRNRNGRTICALSRDNHWMKTHFLLGVMLALGSGALRAQVDTIYECPGRSFTNMITAQEAAARGCKVSSKTQPVITVPALGSRAPAAAPAPTARNVVVASSAGVARSAETRVDPAEQRARDSDARRILEAELRKEEERLAALNKEFNAGEPERRGDERNAVRYQERIADMKANLNRKESDIAALKRELSKLP